MHVRAGDRHVAERRSPKSAVIFLLESHGAAAQVTESVTAESNANVAKFEIGKQRKGRDHWSENGVTAHTMSPVREDF